MEGIFIHSIKEHKRAHKNFWPVTIALRTPSEVGAPGLKHSTEFQAFSVAFSFCVPKVGTQQCFFIFVVLFLYLLSFFFHPQKHMYHIQRPYSGFK